MAHILTHYVSKSKPELTYCGILSAYVLRNQAGVENNRLKELRLRAKKRQDDIVEALQVSGAQVSRWENGKDNIPSSRLPQLAAAYEATIGEIFGEPYPTEDALASALRDALLALPAPELADRLPRPLSQALRAVLAPHQGSPATRASKGSGRVRAPAKDAQSHAPTKRA